MRKNARDVALKSKTLSNLELHNLKADARKKNMFDVCVCNKNRESAGSVLVGHLGICSSVTQSNSRNFWKILQSPTVV